jgi:hypothetical protein
MAYRAIPPRYAGYTRLVDVATSAALDAALSGAQPGDLIRLQLNTVFSSAAPRFAPAKGTKAAPIVVLGDRTCVVTKPTGTASMWLLDGAHWWTLDGFVLDGGGTTTNSTLRVFGSRCCTFRDLKVGNSGQEACAVRGHSKFNRFLFCEFDQTGQVGDLKYGEALYLGRSSSDWVGGLPDRTDYTEVLYCVFGDNITSDSIDIKAGTTGTLVVGCVFSNAGHAREGSDDLGFEAPIAVRGNNAVLRDNHFHKLIKDGVKVELSEPGWGNNNVFRGNRFDLSEATASTRYGVRVSGSTSGNIVYNDNTQIGGTAVSNLSLTAAPAADFTYRVEITPAGGTRQLLAD